MKREESKILDPAKKCPAPPDTISQSRSLFIFSLVSKKDGPPIRQAVSFVDV